MRRYVAMCIVAVLVFIGCRMGPSVGRPRDFVIVASVIDTALVSRNLQIINYFPQPEPNFIFIYASDTAIRVVDKFHTLLLYGSLRDEFIRTLLSPGAREATVRDTFTLFKITDLWARGQTVMVLAVSEPGYIGQGLAKYRGLITAAFADRYYQNLKNRFDSQESDAGVKQALEPFGFKLDVPKGWLIDSTHRRDKFIFLHTHAPDRSIFFYKQKRAGPLTDSAAVRLRNRLTGEYYNGDYLLPELTTSEPITFRDWTGIRLRGVWQNDSLVAGGPFLTYFYNARDSLYVIDGLLFLPGERKTDYLLTLEVIMNSLEITGGNTSP